jgi:hypothetical protein
MLSDLARLEQNKKSSSKPKEPVTRKSSAILPEAIPMIEFSLRMTAKAIERLQLLAAGQCNFVALVRERLRER